MIPPLQNPLSRNETVASDDCRSHVVSDMAEALMRVETVFNEAIAREAQVIAENEKWKLKYEEANERARVLAERLCQLQQQRYDKEKEAETSFARSSYNAGAAPKQASFTAEAEKTVVDGLRRSATSASWPQLLLPADPSFEALYDESRSVVWEKIQRRVDSAGVGAAAAAAVATAGAQAWLGAAATGTRRMPTDSGDPPPKAGFRVVCHAPMRVLSPRPAQQLQSRGAASSPRHKLKANASSLPYQLDTGVAVEAAACSTAAGGDEDCHGASTGPESRADEAARPGDGSEVGAKGMRRSRSSLQLLWTAKPRTVLVVCKRGGGAAVSQALAQAPSLFPLHPATPEPGHHLSRPHLRPCPPTPPAARPVACIS
ncbi:hypothetical protein CYMTET_54508 [Cymbomonas tetramitiformis]|uniref:Uncharacterized protein n=1 Tax=Cymbomonas tetramitiformis TaxID=36881 RepID=A0AAE0BG52_9CHLO|nr:hypothetical protein CYMTET_54508 [Cymbomonas tetramitiformis]